MSRHFPFCFLVPWSKMYMAAYTHLNYFVSGLVNDKSSMPEVGRELKKLLFLRFDPKNRILINCGKLSKYQCGIRQDQQNLQAQIDQII